ncbi:MAG: hypothetical protein RIR62_2213 [Pseudomonadota bacterium]
MTELLTAAQMRDIETAAMGSGAVTGRALMERAGAGVVAAMLEACPALRGGAHRAVVLCGPGNNGGDGFVIARLLQGRGWEVAVFLLGDPARLPPDARENHDRWAATGAVHPLGDVPADAFRGAAVVIDSLFGIGLTRPLPDAALQALAAARQAADRPDGPRIVAVDVPSGLSADTGRPLGPVVPADLTVTFHAPKRGHHLADGPQLCGRLGIVDLGLSGATVDALGDAGRVRLVEGAAAGLGKPLRGHKFAQGHALVLSGPSGHGGAARLAARGALRIGAGLVTLACPPAALAEQAARLDAVMLRPVADAAALEEVLADARINALCLGPALGTGGREAGLVAAALGLPVPGLTRDLAPDGGGGGRGGAGSRPARALVLDADALTILSQAPDLFAALHGACVLTPHAGEFARLFRDIAAKLEAAPTGREAFSKVDAACAAAARAGCVVLFKGPDTVIAAPDGRCALHSAQYDRAAPWLATAGAGDVLAGFIAGLLARGFDPFDAACTGAWLHVECARAFGPGLIAEDLPDLLPAVFRRLGL